MKTSKPMIGIIKPQASGKDQAPTITRFVRQSIEEGLGKLRKECALQRAILKSQKYGWWEPDAYWQDLKKKSIAVTEERMAIADVDLAHFIKEHRSLMPPEWIGNDHGRLCWDSVVGGYPIDTHYCGLPEGHEGPHAGPTGHWPPGTMTARERAMRDLEAAESASKPDARAA